METNMEILMIDPPSGWKYGFPKPYTRTNDKTLQEWLVENGYPQGEVNYWLNSEYFGYVPCRYFSYQCKTIEELDELMEHYGLKEK